MEQDLAQVVQAVGFSLDRLRGKCLLITGGTGFIGTWLLETVSWLNDQRNLAVRVYVPTRSPEQFIRRATHLARPDIVLLRGDVRSFNYPDESCDFIIHAAAPGDPRVWLRNPREVAETIVDGTRHVLDLAVRKQVESFLFVSSGAVYGTQPPDLARIPEGYAGGPEIGTHRSAYGEAKRYAETLCAIYLEDRRVPIRVARPFTFAGPYQEVEGAFAVTEFIRCCLRREPIRIKGDGTAVRTYCYAADLAAALWKILLASEAGRVFNVGSEFEICVADLAHRVSVLGDSPVPTVVEGARVPGRLPSRYVPDTSRLRYQLDFELRYELPEVLERTIRWTRSMLEANAGRAGVMEP